ncbi:MAG: phosphate/phosphite/phosphonate ABC transporter periplasmic binding protein [Osedax symbiont Rs2]|nr:MAG: phosphate/phosphite/phosphonate ABC transporter periplasmic binding protein [Osedax symbiont Rs2]
MSVKYIRSILLILISIFSVMVNGASKNSTKVLTFTAIPDQDQSQLRLRFQQVADYLSAELGVQVNYIAVKSYAAAIGAFRNNQVQLAWFGGLSGVRARQLVPGSRAIAQGIEDREFKSYFIAHHSTGLSRSDSFPQGIAGKTFTFGSKGSTSGRLMPEYYIRQQWQRSPQQLFSAVGFSGDHSLTINQVQAGAYQVGAVNYQVWQSMLAAGKIDLSKVSVIWQTPQYTDYQWSIRAGLDSEYGAGFSDKIQSVLLQMSDPQLLKQFPRSGFIAAANEDYQAIKETAIALDLLQP